MAFVAVPGPFDFALTTERFRAFGVDRATLWHEGGLHRVVAGREVRVEAAPGGVDAEPYDDEIAPVVAAVVGLPFELEPFYAWAAADEVLAHVVHRLRGFGASGRPGSFRRARCSRRSRTPISSASASRGERRSTRSRSHGRTSTCAGSARSPTTR